MLVKVNLFIVLGKAERDNAVNQVKTSEFLQKQFQKKAEETLKNAQ